MAFHFPFEVLLRVRKGLERQQELRLREANLRVAMLHQQVRNVERGMADIFAHRVSRLESGISAAELHFDVLCQSVLIERRRTLEKQLNEADVQRQSCAEDLRRARQQREVMDTLRLHQLQVHVQQHARQEQRQLDDSFLLRRAYLRRS